jgi:hypothetical protein
MTLKPLLKEMRELTNEIIEINKKLFELCVRLHDYIEEEEEKKK